MTSRAVVFKPVAANDLLMLGLHYREINPRLEARFLRGVQEALGQIRDMPELGSRLESDLESLKDVRQWYVKGFDKYLLFYRLEADTLAVIRVLHGARDWPSLVEEGL